MSRVTDHTRTEKIGGDSIYFYDHPSQAGNRYDRYKTTQYDEMTFKHKQQLDMKRKLARNTI